MKTNKLIKRITWIVLPLVTGGLLISSAIVYAHSKSDTTTYSLPYEAYSNIEDVLTFQEQIEETLSIDFNTLKLMNSSTISCDSKGNVLSVDISAYTIKDDNYYSLNIQQNNDEYNCWLTKINSQENGKQAYLEDVLSASYSCFLSTEFTSDTNILFMDETVTNIKDGEWIYQEDSITCLTEAQQGQFTPVNFYYQDTNLTRLVYIERR